MTEEKKIIRSIDQRRILKDGTKKNEVTPSDALKEARRILKIHSERGFALYEQTWLKRNPGLTLEEVEVKIENEFHTQLLYARGLSRRTLFSMLNPNDTGSRAFITPRYVAAAMECVNRLNPKPDEVKDKVITKAPTVLSEDDALKFARKLLETHPSENESTDDDGLVEVCIAGDQTLAEFKLRNLLTEIKQNPTLLGDGFNSAVAHAYLVNKGILKPKK